MDQPSSAISTIPNGTNEFVPQTANVPVILLFRTSWEPSIQPGTALDDAFSALASAYNEQCGFFAVDAEGCPDLSLAYGITVVPSFVLLSSDGKTVQTKLDGIPEIDVLTRAVVSLVSSAPVRAPPPSSEEKETGNADNLDSRLKSLVTSSPVMLFMKGSPSAPRCGFSRQSVEILDSASIAYGTFDILMDEDVRQGLKKYSDWPTYPQLYAHGELMGGLDILKEMMEGGDLAEQLGVQALEAKKSLEERLSELIRRSRILVFIKGIPSAPKCGFSRQIVEILEDIVGEGGRRIAYDSFNILEDEEVRQGLKKYSDWPTYPQLYVDGELVGGLDIVKEMLESGDLQSMLVGSS
eukprot:CAMPEP_0113313832 /NCGR_PEP_ID=MMETSP0010_2-20120614/10105_1 /TAXON_ID=216773 ORGANISM="Corethron hystrix, Strain 308" /NCGR_SAMPLE_ID=MMETSP0010_2 /ASSEMBLY_ACC=CAM_ASM_000155 /LENGTH=352 /DNA_ID=CAMNT_0000169937 /DNA_START=60 /DNA_END=1118 /DNA_ORIENTATION=+ /assembly_acc=CAM_ASM_000155